MKEMKTVVIGRGCVGATVLHNIYDAGGVFSLVDGERFSRLSPLVFNGREMEMETITPAAAFEADIIINTVKNFSLTSTFPLMDGFVGDDTVILPLQNGLESEDVIASRYGREKVVRAFISGLSTHREGSSVTSFTSGLITIGEDDGSLSPGITKLREFFSSTSQPFRISQDIKHDQWVKFMTNTCFNSLTALMEYDYGTFMESGSLLRAVRIVAREVQAVAAAESVTITQDDIEKMIRESSALPPKGRSSMADDIAAGRRNENAWFCGTLSAKAKKHGIKTPSSDLLYILLEAKSGR